MTSHRRALLLRAGVIAALAVGPLALASPAFAAPEDLTIQLSTASFDMKGGDSRALTVRLTNPGNAPETVTVVVDAPSEFSNEVTIETSVGGCSGGGSTHVRSPGVVGPGKPGPNTKDLDFTLRAKSPITSVQPDQTKTGAGSVSIEFSPNSNQDKAFSVKLHGPAQVQSVTEVSGTVADSTTGAVVKAATVTL